MLAIETKNLSKNFGSKKALVSVDLSVETGQIFGLLGPNGAGKTTLIRCLMDFVRSSEGSLKVLGKDSKENSAELKGLVGYLSSDLQLNSNWNSQDHIDLLGKVKGRGRADELVKLLDLDLKTKVKNLSSGNKQKLAIILAFLGNPKILIMDEPTRGLDPLLQNQLYKLLKDVTKNGGTVFLSSHNLPEVQQLCSNVAVIKDGKIVVSEGLDDILQMKVQLVNAVASKNFKLSDFKLANVEVISLEDNKVSLKTHGDINQLIAVLTKYKLSSLEVTHASLEDVFMEYY